MRQLSSTDQNDTDINNYRSPYGMTELRSHSDVITTSLRPSRFHREPTTLPLRLYHAVYDHSTILARPCRPFYDITTFILRQTFSLSFSHKIYKISPGFVCRYLIRTSCPFSLTAKPCFSFLYRIDR